ISARGRAAEQRRAATLSGSGSNSPDPEAAYFFDLVYPLAGFVLGGINVDPPLPPGSGEEPADAVRLPIRSLHDLGESRALRPPDQLQDPSALALRARRFGFLVGGGFRSVFRRLSRLLCDSFGGLRALLGLGPILLVAGALLRGGLGRPNRRALF